MLETRTSGSMKMDPTRKRDKKTPKVICGARWGFLDLVSLIFFLSVA